MVTIVGHLVTTLSIILMFSRNRLLAFSLSASSTATSKFFAARANQARPSFYRHNKALHSVGAGISDAFDGGNIEYVRTVVDDEGDGVTKVILRIKPDPYTELEKVRHSQYFSFRSTLPATKNAPKRVKYVIENAGEASYAKAWEDSTVCFSSFHSDPETWTRKLDTSYSEGQLSWTHDHQSCASVYFAYFPPFSYERHLSLIAKCAEAETAAIESLGQSLDGREMECIKVGKGPRVCWIIHRQHPGESMAEFYAEGLLYRLLGLDSGGSIDGTATRALELYTFYVVPNMCPDGTARGHLRTNACGANLNREWAPTGKPEDEDYYDAPTLERSPEVYAVLKKMDETGVDAFLDVHGDEELPYNFLAGAEGCPNWGPRLENLQGSFLAAYNRANPDMNQEFGYEPEPAGEGRMNICSNQIVSRFDCLGVTLEMPFKDCLSNPDPVRGWTPARARMLGKSVLDALVYVQPYLREDGEFWKGFPEADAYICPTSNYKAN